MADPSLGGPPPLISAPEDNEGSRILAATIATTVPAFITVVMRLFVRLGMIHNVGWDDATVTFAMMLSLTGQGLVAGSVVYGAGRHVGDIDPDVYSTGMKLNFITQPIYLWVICIVKLSIGFSLLRIASTKFWKATIWSVMGFMAFYTLGCFFTIVFQCKDIRALWDNDVPRQCWGMPVLQGLSYTNIALNITTDMLFALVIPVPMLWKLKVPARTRAALVCVLALGLFACAAALVKVTYIVNYGVVGDFLWDSRNITIWTVTESNVGIIAGSIPPLRPLFKTIFGGVYGYGTGSKKTSGTPGYYAKGSRAGGGLRSNKDWQALSSAQRKGGSGKRDEYDIGDDSGSERAINAAAAGADAFELGGFRRSPSGAVRTIITSQANQSDDSLDRSMVASPGITKMTETTVAVTEQRRD